MLFSVIIPAYNAANYIKDAIESVVKQPFFDYEIIVVNDGSKDNTLKILNKLARKYVNLRIIAQNNSGASVARNNGINHAKGEYIFFMDADDVLVENSFVKISEILIEKKPDVLIGLYTMLNIDTNKVIIEKDSSISSLEINDKPYEDALKVLKKYRLSSCPWRYFIKRNLILNHNLYFIENSFVEDAIWVPMLLTSAKSFYLNDVVFYKYQLHSNSVSSTKTFKFYQDALEGCDILTKYKHDLNNTQKELVETYYMMLLVGVMQDYDNFENENKKYIDEWFRLNLDNIKESSKSIRMLGIVNKFLDPKASLLYLGRYLKRKNRLD